MKALWKQVTADMLSQALYQCTVSIKVEYHIEPARKINAFSFNQASFTCTSISGLGEHVGVGFSAPLGAKWGP